MPSKPCPSIPVSSSELLIEPRFDLPPHDWLTTSEAAQYLQVKTRTLLFWVRHGKIKEQPLSGAKRRVWRFPQGDLDAFLIHSTPVIISAKLSVRSTERRA